MRQFAFSANAKTNSVGGLNPPNLLRIYTCVIKTTREKKLLLTPYVYWKIKSKLAAVSLNACAWRRAHSRVGIHLKWRSSFKHLCVCWFIYLFIQLPLSLPVVLRDYVGFFWNNFVQQPFFVGKYCTYQKFGNALCKTRVLHFLALWRNKTCSTLFVPSSSCSAVQPFVHAFCSCMNKRQPKTS